MSEKNNINFEFNCNYIPSCHNNFNFPDMGCNGFPPVSIYGGESVSFQIIDSNEINVYAGSTLTADLEINELPFLFDSYDGSETTATVIISRNFSQDFYDGSTLTVNDIVVNKPIPLGISNSYDGSWSLGALSLNSLFALDIHYGQELKLELNTSSVPNLDINVYSGEVNNTALSCTALLNGNNYYSGEEIKLDLHTIEVSGLELKSYCGDEVVVDQLSVELNLPVSVLSGEEVLFDLNYDYQALSLNAYTGTELLNITLEEQEHPYFQSTIEHGNNVFVDLKFDSIALKPLIYSGEELTSELVIKDDVEFTTISSYSGQYVEPFNFYYTYRTLTPVVIEHAGSTVNLEMILDKTDWFTGSMGDTTEFDLRTFSSIKSELYAGETFEPNIEQTPRIDFRSVCYSGESVLGDLRHLFSPSLTPLRITYDQWCDFNIDEQTTHFELCTCCGYPIYHWIFEFRLNANNDPRTRCSDEIGTSTFIDLRLNRRFEFNCFDGQVVNYSQDEFINFKYISPFEDGAEIIPFELGGDQNISLEPGNVIPDGGDANVELNPPEFLIKEKTSFRSGEYCLTNLHIRPVVSSVLETTSEHVDVSLVIDNERTRIDCWHGDMVWCNLRTNVQLQGWKAYDGSYMNTFKLDFPPEYMYAGEEVNVILKNHYDVEFLEEGCVDNEYLVIDQEGKIDYDKSTKACIEFLPFEHSLKARCY